MNKQCDKTRKSYVEDLKTKDFLRKTKTLRLKLTKEMLDFDKDKIF